MPSTEQTPHLQHGLPGPQESGPRSSFHAPKLPKAVRPHAPWALHVGTLLTLELGIPRKPSPTPKSPSLAPVGCYQAPLLELIF